VFEKILVAIDSREQRRGPLTYASQLAKGFTIPVVLLQISPNDGVPGVRPASDLAEPAARLSADQVPVESMTETGKDGDDVLCTAEQYGCELIVMSPHLGTRNDKGLGSVTTQTLRGTQVPLLLVPPGHSHSIRNIVVSLDGSALAEVALPYTEEIARRLGVPICLARAYQPWMMTMAGIEGYAYPGSTDLVTAETEAIDYLRVVASRLAPVGQPVDCQALKGTPAKVIVGLAAHTPGSLITLTTHGRSGLARWLLGSVTEEMARSTSNPILIIPHKFGFKYAQGVTELLQQTPLFARLREKELKELSQVARIRTFASGDEIVREGDEGNEFFIVSSGRVDVIKNAATPEEFKMGILGPGDFFGELSLLDDEPRSATVRAAGDVECVSINRVDFTEHLNKHPQTAVMMLPALARRLRRATGQSVGG
jgi:nucleotide-binding universal stress UspA family protein